MLICGFIENAGYLVEGSEQSACSSPGDGHCETQVAWYPKYLAQWSNPLCFREHPRGIC